MSEITNVLYSEYIYEGKTGAWKKQLSEITDGRYLVEVYWDPWIGEVGHEEQRERYFTDLKEAETFYQGVKTIAQARKRMERFSCAPSTRLSDFGKKLSKDYCPVCGLKLYRRKITNLETGEEEWKWIHLSFIGPRPGDEVKIECPGARGGRAGGLNA